MSVNDTRNELYLLRNIFCLVQRPVQEIVITSKTLSSREMNLAKRKARLAFSKQKSRDCSEDGPSAPPTPTTPVEPDRKKIKLEQPEEFVCEYLLCLDYYC